jgi:alkyl hydroperoxide reductase subunit F
MYDLVIIGGGPAGVSAGIYAARKKIKSAIITESFGGQSIVSTEIQNWIGTPSISGFDLAKQMESHLRVFKDDIDIVEGDIATNITKNSDGTFAVKTREGKDLQTKFILLACGSRRRRLGIPGEDAFDGKGVVFCSTCDAPMFKDKTVVVVGGGNAGLESAHDLFPYASKIYLMVRSDSLKGDPVTQEKVKANPKVEIIYNAEAQEILGDKFVDTFKYKDKISGEVKELKVDGVFVEIGSMPNSEMVKGLVNINERGEIIVNHQTQETSNPGIWAVGDVSDVLYKQNNISAGDGTKAVLNIYDHLRKH